MSNKQDTESPIRVADAAMAETVGSILDGDEAVVRQICFVVADVDEAIARQLAVADAGSFRAWQATPEFFKTLSYRGEPASFSLRYALNAQAPQIEVVQPLNGPSVFHEHVEQAGYGFHHVAYWVDDIDSKLERIAAAGFDIVQEVTGWGAEGDGHALFLDTREATGCWTELVAPPRLRKPTS